MKYVGINLTKDVYHLYTGNVFQNTQSDQLIHKKASLPDKHPFSLLSH